MDRAALYLHVPRDYFTCMGFGLRWSADGETIGYDDGRTFAFAAAVTLFAEGFAAQRPLIHFGHMLHLLRILDGNACTLNDPGEAKRVNAAFQATGRNYRNAGTFFAVVCAGVPGVADRTPAVELARYLSLRILGLAAEPTDTAGVEKPPLGPAVFEWKVLRATAVYDEAALRHWLRHGRGPLNQEAAVVADAVRRAPRTLADVLDDASRRQRLAGAAPFVEQLTGALALPPRRLARPEMPLGGYADVTTRGGPEQILPSQFALDDLEFVRRCAERELLYYRREEPHDRTREDLVVLLDQGVRTWGAVRLVLGAAVFALGRLADGRRLPFRVAATGARGVVYDPLEMNEDAFAALLEASDLNADPGAAVEKVLSEETDGPRDVVLLTHPRNLDEANVRAAARTLRPGSRLFAVAVNDRGDVEFSEVRHGAPVRLSRFHVDLNRTAPPPPVRPQAPDPWAMWRGDVEPVPFPFVFGVANRGPFHCDFDGAGEWLVTATASGTLHATRTDGSRVEVLPRAMVAGRVFTEVHAVLGVAGGVAVVGATPAKLAFVAHYDFGARTCTGHLLEWTASRPWTWRYVRDLHSVVATDGKAFQGVDLSTGDKGHVGTCTKVNPSTRASEACLRARGAAALSAGEVFLEPVSGEVTLENGETTWRPFTPLSDGRPMLKGCKLLGACRRAGTLALAVFDASSGPTDQRFRLCLFRGPQGVPLAQYRLFRAQGRFTLSPDGRLLAHEDGAGRLEVHDVNVGGPPLCVTRTGRTNPKTTAVLGDRWVLLRVPGASHLIRWDAGRLAWTKSHRDVSPTLRAELGPTSLSQAGTATQRRWPSGALAYDPRRFLQSAQARLTVVVDAFGQTALFGPKGELVCMFFVHGGELAAWAPPNVRYGPAALLGAPQTPGADETIGRALLAAWERSEARSP